MSISVTPIPRLTVLTAPAFTLGTANAAGSAITAVASDSTLLAFDATVPDAITFGQSGAAGVAVVPPRRDHAHAMAALTAAAGASTVLIATVVADNDASLTLTGISSTYDTYLFAWADIVPATDDDTMYFRVGDSSGVDSGSTDYEYVIQRLVTNATTYASSASVGASSIRVGSSAGNQAGEGIAGFGYLNRPGGGTTYPMITGQSASNSGSKELNANPFYGMRKAEMADPPLDRINIFFSGGDIATGRFTVWGIKHA